MEYVKIEGQFPKFSHCAVTLENSMESIVVTGN